MDMRAATFTDDGTDGQWMTYTELAELRRIDKPSAVKLAIRRKWRRQKNNRGQMQVFVPADWIAPGRDKSVDTGADLSRVISALEAAVAGLRDRAEAAERRADKAEARAERTEAERDRLRERIAELERQLAEARAVETSALHQSAWGAASNDQSAAADPAHQVERLWQRMTELETQLEQARAPEAEPVAEGNPRETQHESADRPRRWWRRVLRRR